MPDEEKEGLDTRWHFHFQGGKVEKGKTRRGGGRLRKGSRKVLHKEGAVAEKNETENGKHRPGAQRLIARLI